MIDKVDKEFRTFETRLLYIRDIFAEKYSQEEILKSSIEHKLQVSYEEYVNELKRSLALLQALDAPTKILKKVN